MTKSLGTRHCSTPTKKAGDTSPVHEQHNDTNPLHSPNLLCLWNLLHSRRLISVLLVSVIVVAFIKTIGLDKLDENHPLADAFCIHDQWTSVWKSPRLSSLERRFLLSDIPPNTSSAASPVEITIPHVDCTNWIQMADNKKDEKSETSSSSSHLVDWTDPYHGKSIIPYTLPKPAPHSIQIGLYQKEMQFIKHEVTSKQSHVRHTGQRIVLQILQLHSRNNNQEKTASGMGGNNNNKNIIQVGGQIGWLALQAAAIGYNVSILEANPIHIVRTCRNVQLNTNRIPSNLIHLYHTLVVANDTATTDGNVNRPPISTDQVDLSGRLGRGTFAHQVEFIPGMMKSIYPIEQQNHLPISTTTVDDWAISQSFLPRRDDPTISKLVSTAATITLMKVDVAKGRETQVIRGAQHLLQSQQVLNLMLDIEIFDDEGAMDILQNEFHPHRIMIELLLQSGYQMNNKWDKRDTSQNPIFYPTADTKDSTATIIQKIYQNMRQFCGQANKGCHVWWRLVA